MPGVRTEGWRMTSSKVDRAWWTMSGLSTLSTRRRATEVSYIVRGGRLHQEVAARPRSAPDAPPKHPRDAPEAATELLPSEMRSAMCPVMRLAMRPAMRASKSTSIFILESDSPGPKSPKKSENFEKQIWKICLLRAY